MEDGKDGGGVEGGGWGIKGGGERELGRAGLI